eukprot:TRINITY_DN3107_c0_g1_i6.p1 TRINITY_DN3107_c0_g1~~TRINITY_DN3107_c0_g1_i6.p1  ORF type:complete len:454 (+),score=82.44 TRINITY_DN3107_c0_g1_i6:163-1524(+)
MSQRCQWTVKGVSFHCPSHYQPLDNKPIGTGAYAVVAGATDTRDGSRVAIKRCSKVLAQTNDAHEATVAKRMLREILLLRALDHPNVINILQMWHNDKDVYLVEPLMEADLHRVIRSGQQLTDDHFQFFVWQILRGLKYMHSANVIHRDLKPANILVNSNCDVKICDFGLARAVEEEELGKTMYVVTRWYRAPELMIADDYSEAVDMWAVGCILAEFLGRKALFPGKSSMHQMQLITSVLGPISPADMAGYTKNPSAGSLLRSLQNGQDFQPRPWNQRYPKATEKALALLQKLLVYHPAKRPTATETLADPWLADHHLLSSEPDAPARLDFDFEHIRNAKATDLCQLLKEQAQQLDGRTDPSACHMPSQDVKLPPVPGAQKKPRPVPERENTGISPVKVQTPIAIGADDFHGITAYADQAPPLEAEPEERRLPDAQQKPSDENKKCGCKCVLM